MQSTSRPVDPRVPSSLSLIVCGAGQLYNRQTRLGILFLLTELLAVAIHWAVIDRWSSLSQVARLVGLEGDRLQVAALCIESVLVLFILGQVFQAYHRAEGLAGQPRPRPHPMLAGLASLLIPGWGQILNAQIGKALFFLGAALVGSAALIVSAPGAEFSGLIADLLSGSRFLGGAAGIVTVSFASWMISVHDAVLVAGLRRRRGQEAS